MKKFEKLLAELENMNMDEQKMNRDQKTLMQMLQHHGIKKMEEWGRIALSDLVKAWNKAFLNHDKDLCDKGYNIELATCVQEGKDGELESVGIVYNMLILNLGLPYQLMMVHSAEEVDCKMYGLMYEITVEDIETFMNSVCKGYDGSGYVYCRYIRV